MTALEELPARVSALESQVSQLRDEMRSEFSATRDEIRAGDEEIQRTLRDEIRAGDEEIQRTLRDEIRAGDEETRRVLGQQIEDAKRVLNDRIDERSNEVMNHARALHEAMVENIKTMGEGNARRQ